MREIFAFEALAHIFKCASLLFFIIVQLVCCVLDSLGSCFYICENFKKIIRYGFLYEELKVSVENYWLLTLSLPSSNYYTSPPSLSASNLPPPSPANSCVFYIILPSERKFYPQVGSTRTGFAGTRQGCIMRFCHRENKVCTDKAFLRNFCILVH